MIHVVGASGRSGVALCRSLAADGLAFAPVVRNPERWAGTGLPGEPMVADLTDAARLRCALAGATQVVSCAHARHASAILDATPAQARFVFLGSTRKYTAWPDAHGRGVLAGEAVFLASGRTGMMLHPTMIYGAQGEDNVQRLAALLRWLPAVPLPGGGRALVQPIHQDDVTACVRAALRATGQPPAALVIAGPSPLRYADFVRAVACAAGRRPPVVVGVPAVLLRAAVRPLAALPWLPRVTPDEIRRLTEDKAFDIGPMRQVLGVAPRSLEAGLAGLFASGGPGKRSVAA